MSKNGDSPKNGKGNLDFSKFKISSGSSDMPIARKIIYMFRFPNLQSRGTSECSVIETTTLTALY